MVTSVRTSNTPTINFLLHGIGDANSSHVKLVHNLEATVQTCTVAAGFTHTILIRCSHHNVAHATDGVANKLNVTVRNNGANLPAILRAVDWRCQEAR